jgi:hypothetical protein
VCVCENFCTCQKKRNSKICQSVFFIHRPRVCVWNKRTKAHRHEKKTRKNIF